MSVIQSHTNTRITLNKLTSSYYWKCEARQRPTYRTYLLPVLSWSTPCASLLFLSQLLALLIGHHIIIGQRRRMNRAREIRRQMLDFFLPFFIRFPQSHHHRNPFCYLQLLPVTPKLSSMASQLAIHPASQPVSPLLSRQHRCSCSFFAAARALTVIYK